MSKKVYVSRIDKPENHTTANGGSYVTAFDVVRSTAGRELISKHAAMKVSCQPPNGNPSDHQSNGRENERK